LYQSRLPDETKNNSGDMSNTFSIEENARESKRMYAMLDSGNPRSFNGLSRRERRLCGA